MRSKIGNCFAVEIRFFNVWEMRGTFKNREARVGQQISDFAVELSATVAVKPSRQHQCLSLDFRPHLERVVRIAGQLVKRLRHRAAGLKETVELEPRGAVALHSARGRSAVSGGAAATTESQGNGCLTS